MGESIMMIKRIVKAFRGKDGEIFEAAL